MAQLKQPTTKKSSSGSVSATAKQRCKIPAFVDGTDNLDSYLLRYERFARTNEWEESCWAVNLSVLLTGRALDVYSRMEEDEANDYGALKRALQKRYNLTEDGMAIGKGLEIISLKTKNPRSSMCLD